MRKLFNIDQDEKNRILEMHENATKRHYLNEYSGVAFGDEQNGLKIEKVETKEQSAPVSLKPVDTKSVVQKALDMFPPVQWYNSIKGKEIGAEDPNAIKAFNIARRFFDNKIPQLSVNDDKFFQYVKQNGGETTSGVMNYVHGMIGGTKYIFDILIPTLQASNYPNTKPFQGSGDNAVASASKVNPNISKLVQTHGGPASVLYNEITKTV
jgi:hypothetical protein